MNYTQIDSAPSSDAFGTSLSALRDLTTQTVREIKKARLGKLTENDHQFSRKTEALVKEALELSASIPRFSSNCN